MRRLAVAMICDGAGTACPHTSERGFVMRRAICVTSLLVLALGISAAAGASLTFFGEDLNNSETVPLTSWDNATAAEADFLSYLTGVGTETFESFDDGDGAPLTLTFPGVGTAQLTGNGAVDSVPYGSTNGKGRYNISDPVETTTDYWEVLSGAPFTIDFGSPVAAFGFYGIDIGDFQGQVTVTTEDGAPFTYIIPHSTGTSGSIGGSVLYWGVIDTADPFIKVTFGNTGSGDDNFAFDDMTIGTVEQVTAVPEPCSALLLGAALPGIAFWRKRRRSR